MVITFGPINITSIFFFNIYNYLRLIIWYLHFKNVYYHWGAMEFSIGRGGVITNNQLKLVVNVVLETQIRGFIGH